MRRSVLVLLATLALGACAAVAPHTPRTAEEQAALAKARDLHWVVESADGRFIGSATAFGPGRLVTNAHVVEPWVGHALRVRQGSQVHPVRHLALAVGQDVALLHVVAPRLPAPHTAERPKVNDRVLVAGATRHSIHDGAGVVIPAVAGTHRAQDFITARLPVLRGFSGGPVVDAQGRLVGITTAALVHRYADHTLLNHAEPGMALDLRTALVLPSALVQAVLRTEGLD